MGAIKMKELIELYKEDPKTFWQELGGAFFLMCSLYVFTVLMFCM